MAETPKKPNMSPPSKPAGKTGSQGNFNELTKTLRDIRDMQAADMKDRKDSAGFEQKLMIAEQVEQLHMINIMKGVEASIKKNTETLKKEMSDSQKQFKESLSKITEKGESSEDKKEEEEKDKKRWEGLKNALKNGMSWGKDGVKGIFGGLWSMLKKFKGVLLAIGLGAILANINVGDLKKTWIKVKEFFTATREFFVPIAKWMEQDFFPSTMELFFSTMDNLTNLFKDLTKNFDGFMEKGWVGKSKSILKTLKDIGHSTGQFFMDVLDWTGGLLGKKGKISDDIKNFLDTKFAPDVSAGIYDLFETVAGGFAIMAVLGMSPIKFMSSMGKFLFGSIRILFTTIALALTPVGLGLTLSALTMAFSDEIIRGIENFVGRMKVGFKNIFIDLHNALASTTVGEYVLKLKPKDRIKDWSDEEEAKKYKANKQKEIAALEKSIAGQEQWKELSALPDGGGRRTQEMMQNLKHTKQFRSQEEVKLKAQKSFLAKEKKDLADFESTWSSQLGQSPSKSPYKPDFMSFFPSRESFSSILGEGGSFMDQTMRNEEFRSSAYDDAGGRSIGYGFHVSKDGADKVLTDAQINKSAADLMSGKENLTREEALTIYLAEKKFFSNAAKNWIGATEWEKLNGGQKQALYDMSYNMGAGFYKEGNWPDLKKAIIANDDDGIASGIMLNASGNGPSKYSQDVKGRAQQNITALQRDGRILTPNLWGSGAGGAPVIVTDNSQTSSSENLFSSAGNRATSTHPSFIDQLGGRFNSNVGSLAGG